MRRALWFPKGKGNGRPKNGKGIQHEDEEKGMYTHDG
jgi:hypothetical protein